MSFIDSFTDNLTKHFRIHTFTRLDYLVAGLSFLIAMVLYTVTMTPSVSAGDNGELTTAIFYLGVAHAPSYPLHSFMGKLFTYLPINNVGWRANFFSVVCGSLTIYFSVLLYIKLLASSGLNRVYTSLAALLTGMAFMTSTTLWSQAVMCEVYTMSSVFFPLLTLILLRWHDEVVAHRDNDLPYFGEKYLLAYAFLFGVAMAGHQTILVTSLFGFAYIMFILWSNIIRKRPLSGSQIFSGLGLLAFLAIAMAVAYGVYYTKIVSLGSNLYDTSNVKIGMITFIVGNAVVLLLYGYYRFIATDKVDPHNFLQKGFFVAVKMFMIFYLGYAIHLYMVIRAHGNPPINWMGINEVEDWWLKWGKFFNAIWRKQYGDMGKLPLSLSNLSVEFKLLFTKLLGVQFSAIFYGFFIAGLVKLFLHYRLWFWSSLLMLGSYAVVMTIFLRYQFDDRSLSFVIVFYIFAYFALTIPMAFGIAFFMQGLDKLLSLFSKPAKAP